MGGKKSGKTSRGRTARKPRLPTPWEDVLATGRTASRALSIFKGGASLLNAEVKSADTALSGAVSSSGTVTLISGVAQGDGNGNRDGNSLKLKGGAVRWFYSIHASATRTLVRTIVFVDRRSLGTAPSVSDVITSASIVALANLVAEPGRYLVLYDRVQSLSITGSQLAFGECELPALQDVHLTYSGTGATVASINGPAVFVLTLSSEGTNTPTVSGLARIEFLDN